MCVTLPDTQRHFQDSYYYTHYLHSNFSISELLHINHAILSS